MEDGFSNKNIVRIRDSEAARILTDPQARRWLEPFMRAEISLSEAAQALGVKLSTLHHRMQKFVRLGLIEVVREVPRKGRAVKLYRASAETFFVPFELMPSVSLDEHLAQLASETATLIARNFARVLLERSPAWGFRVYLDPQHGLLSDMRPSGPDALLRTGGETPAAWISDLELNLDPATAKVLERELAALFERYAGLQHDQGQSYHLLLGLAPLTASDRS